MANTSIVALEQAWKERCERGTFSPAILGLGTIRVMGKSGDAAIQFPRIASLDALSSLYASAYGPKKFGFREQPSFATLKTTSRVTLSSTGPPITRTSTSHSRQTSLLRRYKPS